MWVRQLQEECVRIDDCPRSAAARAQRHTSRPLHHDRGREWLPRVPAILVVRDHPLLLGLHHPPPTARVLMRPSPEQPALSRPSARSHRALAWAYQDASHYSLAGDSVRSVAARPAPQASVSCTRAFAFASNALTPPPSVARGMWPAENDEPRTISVGRPVSQHQPAHFITTRNGMPRPRLVQSTARASPPPSSQSPAFTARGILLRHGAW